MNALIVVDMQRDFLPGGALGVPEGNLIIGPICQFGEQFEHVALTRDWHPDDHVSFSDNPKFVDGSWPAHCVQNTSGAEIHEEILEAFPDAPIFSKGWVRDTEAYSGFDGTAENGQFLHEWLDNVGAERVYVVGLALDYCVKATVLDANYYGLYTGVPLHLTRPVSYDTGMQAVADLSDDGVALCGPDHFRDRRI